VTESLALWPREAEPWHISPQFKFTGRTEVHAVSEALGVATMRINALWFEAGARSRPHTHDADQVLFYFHGTGLVAVDGGEDQRVEAGQFVRLPGNLVHMHGAWPGSEAAHISLMPLSHTTDFECAVPAAWRQYRLDGRRTDGD
jgi:quercetin dioxygenase-like cupin family protein